MEVKTLEKMLLRGIIGLGALIGTNIFLIQYGLQLPLTIITLAFSILIGWPAVLIMLVTVMLV